ncbi:hypothetical protein [Bartonella sp. B1098]|uniref:hypothetical protein n=1 Tax=Bartonella sp. B1098 TaxID=2911421 RepID=UPI0020C2FB9C|nr:hypothetical protein [Bartonella sp. B1098]
MENNSDNIFSRLLKSIYAMDPLTSRILMQNQRMAREDAKQQANNFPYLIPSSSIATFGSQPNIHGLAKNIPPLPDVSSSLRPAGFKPDVPSSVPSLPIATFGSQQNPLGLGKDIEPLPNAISDLASLQPKQAQLPEPISTVEPQKSVQPQQSVVPNQTAGSQQSFWDHLRSPEFLQRLADYGIGYALSDGTVAQSLASGAMNLRRGDMEREKRGQVNQTVEYLKSKGYSEEEAAVMARNPQMLSALLTGGKTPEGFQSYTNPETGELEYRPVKGSMQELEYNQKKKEIEEWEINKRNAAAIAAKEIDSIMGTVNDALQLIDANPDKVAGIIGSLGQYVPGSDANSLKKKFKQLEGGIFTRVIETIKKQSENGSLGVGPLSNEESARLVASYGSLDISDKPEELHKTLLKIKDMFDLFKQLNDEEIYRLSKGMEVRPRSNPSAQYSNQSISQGGGANLPTISSREELYNYPPGTVVDYNGTPVYREAKR